MLDQAQCVVPLVERLLAASYRGATAAECFAQSGGLTRRILRDLDDWEPLTTRVLTPTPGRCRCASSVEPWLGPLTFRPRRSRLKACPRRLSTARPSAARRSPRITYTCAWERVQTIGLDRLRQMGRLETDNVKRENDAKFSPPPPMRLAAPGLILTKRDVADLLPLLAFALAVELPRVSAGSVVWSSCLPKEKNRTIFTGYVRFAVRYCEGPTHPGAMPRHPAWLDDLPVRGG